MGVGDELDLDQFDFDAETFYEDDLTTEEQAVASHDLLQKFGDKNSCMALTEKRPTAKVFKWKGKDWIVIGSVSSKVTGYTSVELRSVTPADESTLPINNSRLRGASYYTGWRFKDKKAEWVIDAYELVVYSEKYLKAEQGVLL